MFHRAILLSIIALASGATACGGLNQMQPRNPSNATKAANSSIPSATDLDTSSAQTREWEMPLLAPARETSGTTRTTGSNSGAVTGASGY
jgi:hypothetical protein